ncbi:MAG TPA: DUF1876 domain-containing protein [Acidimicrobiia bacterium]|nr:DUF1876 domain-containing protein [Acidimicrobiia bacterium]
MHDKLKIKIEVEQDPAHTEARATLRLAGREYHGSGRARRNPVDPNVPMVGEELAVARALSDLSHELVEAAADGIERFEGHPVELFA